MFEKYVDKTVENYYGKMLGAFIEGFFEKFDRK